MSYGFEITDSVGGRFGDGYFAPFFISSLYINNTTEIVYANYGLTSDKAFVICQPIGDTDFISGIKPTKKMSSIDLMEDRAVITVRNGDVFLVIIGGVNG